MEPMETAIWSVPARHWMIIDRRGYSSLLNVTLHNVTYRRIAYARRVTTNSHISVKTLAQSP